MGPDSVRPPNRSRSWSGRSSRPTSITPSTSFRVRLPGPVRLRKEERTLANVRVPDGTIIELEPENLIGRGRAEAAGPRKIDVGRYQGGRTVSHRHAQIYRVEKEWYLWVEPDARNDTLVDDQTIPRGEKVRLNRE